VSAEVLGPYELDEPWLEDAFTETARACRRDIGRTVLVRRLRRGLDVRGSFARTLAWEARVLSGLDHPVLARLGELELPLEGAPHDAPAYLVLGDPGEVSLAKCLVALAGGAPRARPDSRQRLRAIAVGYELARGLAHAHARGVVHRAVRPAAVGVSSRGALCLVDWSSAIEVEREGEPPEPGRVIAESPYLAPELRREARATPATDVFSVGAVVLALSTLSPLPSEPTQLGAAVAGVAELMPELGAVLSRCVALAAAERPEGGAELTELFAALLPSRDAERAALVRQLVAELVDPGALAARAADRAEPPTAHPVALLALLGALVVGAALVTELVFRERRASLLGAPAPSGAVRVLARPWADVHVDGALVDTTPVGRPLALSPGRHDLRFVHPAAPDELRTIDVRPGETLVVDVVMRIPSGAVDAGTPDGGAEEQP
jgi:hypothetical protein